MFKRVLKSKIIKYKKNSPSKKRTLMRKFKRRKLRYNNATKKYMNCKQRMRGKKD
jgi:hypothetical protein